jgi:5-methylcytosine-specific restriction endonuclease McrA
LNCTYCGIETKNPKFCSSSCAAIFNNTGSKQSFETKAKISIANKGRTWNGKTSWNQGIKPTPELIAKRLAGYTPEKRKQAALKVKQKTRAKLEIKFSLLEKGFNSSEYVLRLYMIEKIGKCVKCRLSRWSDKPLMLELHHIDGNDKNNNLENAQLLCPNCHSQTHNFRNKKRPSDGMVDNKVSKTLAA